MTSNILTSIYDSYKQFYIPNNKPSDGKKNVRSVVSSMEKINKESPLYITNNSQESKDNLINIKESAIELYYRLNQATGKNSGFDSILDKKMPESTNEDIATVSFLNRTINLEDTKEYKLSVENVAQKQVNIGKFLPNEITKLSAGVHSFDATIDDTSYEIQFNVKENETNKNIQERLSRLINKSVPGLHADVIEDGMGDSALKISADDVGFKNDNNLKFTFKSNDNISVEYLGLSNVNNKPENSKIYLDDEYYELNSNTFELGELFEVTIKGKSKTQNDTTQIKIASDADAIVESVEEMVYGYNKFLDSIHSNEFTWNMQIAKEFGNLAYIYKEKFEDIGLEIKNNKFVVDTEKLKDAANNKQDLASIKEFSELISKKVKEISVNPIKYVDKKIAAYKNPTKPQFSNPYVSSNYTGMFLDQSY